MTLPFRSRVYAWRHDEATHGPAEESIPAQLQRLFARLQLSNRMAVDTTALTKSFGWVAADACRQQDVQELLHVLFDALDRYIACGHNGVETAFAYQCCARRTGSP